jgi:hypothetical protein
MNNQPAKSDITKLPNWLQGKIKELDVSDPEQWIKRRIPALGNRSVVEVIADSNGEKLLHEYFSKVMGRF